MTIKEKTQIHSCMGQNRKLFFLSIFYFLSLYIKNILFCSFVSFCFSFPTADPHVLHPNTLSSLSSHQFSSWLQDCWSTLSALTPHWSAPSAETPTSTTPASARSVGATCWRLSESCSLFSCPFLPNMPQRSSCRPPLCPPCYSSTS